MAEPTLKEVLNAISRLEKGQAEIRQDMARKDDVDRRFDKVDKAIAELDADLDRHMTTHGKIEKQIEALKARPATRPARRPRARSR
jgi:hypothetical protein